MCWNIRIQRVHQCDIEKQNDDQKTTDTKINIFMGKSGCANGKTSLKKRNYNSK